MRQARRRVLLLQAWWENGILKGAGRHAVERNWILDCEMMWTHRVPSRWKGDGIIVYADRDRSVIDFVRQCRVPVVDLSSFGDSFGAPKVTISNPGIAREAVGHLAGLGFRDFGGLVSSDHPIDLLRLACFEREAIRAGGRFHLLPLPQLARQLGRLPRPMGLLACKDQDALEAIRLCQDAGHAVPEEFAVVGVNDTDVLCDVTAIPLTSVNPDFEQNGYRAAALLERLMDGKPAPRGPIVVPPRGITRRRSTDTLSIPDLDTAKALRFLRDHFLEPVSVSRAADGLATPLRQIQTRFREATGRTMVQELARLRIAHAQKLLDDPRAKTETVARESGFASRPYFVRAFRRLTGTTPTAYRKSLGAGRPAERDIP